MFIKRPSCCSGDSECNFWNNAEKMSSKSIFSRCKYQKSKKLCSFEKYFSNQNDPRYKKNEVSTTVPERFRQSLIIFHQNLEKKMKKLEVVQVYYQNGPLDTQNGVLQQCRKVVSKSQNTPRYWSEKENNKFKTFRKIFHSKSSSGHVECGFHNRAWRFHQTPEIWRS